mmetsp:Transcript_33094/g.53334  ORF Transcript_33094/g.53334 Transcript_33094/m.53334 type:complete len:206 (+) Transcript_33094:112-729(+)
MVVAPVAAHAPGLHGLAVLVDSVQGDGVAASRISCLSDRLRLVAGYVLARCGGCNGCAAVGFRPETHCCLAVCSLGTGSRVYDSRCCARGCAQGGSATRSALVPPQSRRSHRAPSPRSHRRARAQTRAPHHSLSHSLPAANSRTRVPPCNGCPPVGAKWHVPAVPVTRLHDRCTSTRVAAACVAAAYYGALPPTNLVQTVARNLD